MAIIQSSNSFRKCAATLLMLSGCATPIMWQGPSGLTDQQMAQARYACHQEAEADRARMMQMATQQQNPYLALALPGRADDMFKMCMEANGYKLVPEQATPTSNDGTGNGQGTLSSPNGDKYVGEYRNNKPNGQGTFTSHDGKKYIGEWKDGKRNGQGTFMLPDGGKYVGEWKDDNPNGQGIEYSANGNKYIGEFRDGHKVGQGTFTFPDGRKYVGQFRDNKRDGQGAFTFPDGRKYVGTWKDDHPNGEGTEYRGDGSILRFGVFENDAFVKGQ